MIAIKPLTPLPAGTPGAAASLNLHERLEAATEALLKTRDQVVEALDHHLQELDSLRQALRTSNDPRPANPVAAAIASASAEFAPFGTPSYFERPPAAGSMPAPALPVLPLLTQVLWPAKPVDAELPSPLTPVSSPLVAYSSMPGIASRDQAMDPNLEKATLEELNAALAQAFSHVSKARSGTANGSQALSAASVSSGAPSWPGSSSQGFGLGR